MIESLTNLASDDRAGGEHDEELNPHHKALVKHHMVKKPKHP
jgi:hypothetical protein